MQNIQFNNHSKTSLSANKSYMDKPSNNLQVTAHKNNFLYDVIMPNIYDVQNIKIIQKNALKTSPQSANRNIFEMKKSKIQKKIEFIVKKNTQQQTKTINNTPKLKKYTKQNIMKVSKFAQQQKYRQFLYNQQITLDKMKFKKCKQTSIIDKYNGKRKDQNYNKNQTYLAQSITMEEYQSPFMIQMDEAIGQKRKMEEESFQPFKEKVKKVLERTIELGKNGNVNTLMEKVNFYLTSISQSAKKQTVRKVIIDPQQRDKQIMSYCEELSKGIIQNFKKSSSNLGKSGLNAGQVKQLRSSSAVKLRPQTAALTSRTNFLSSADNLTANRSISTSRLNRYTVSSCRQNVNYKSGSQKQKRKCLNLIDQIESTYWESQISKQILSKKLNSMQQQWKIDDHGCMVYENKRMDMDETALEMIKRIRQRGEDMEKIQIFVMED